MTSSRASHGFALIIAGVILFIILRSGWQMHYYSVPGHTGIVAGDCYHFDIGVEVQTGFYIDQC